MSLEFECLRCGYVFESEEINPTCPECGSEEVVVLV
jgi:predicted Zn-ribbon and HTH transcriptional regulator